MQSKIFPTNPLWIIDNYKFFTKLVKKLGYNPDEGVLKYGEKFTNFLQTLYATKAQDVITKSIELMYNIDKQMRMKYGKS